MVSYTAVVVLFAAAISAAPQNLGQSGSLECIIARLQIVSALGDAGDSIAAIQDPDTASAAQVGFDQAQGGISQIGQAIAAGEVPPQDGRDQVEAGLAAIGEALAEGDT